MGWNPSSDILRHQILKSSSTTLKKYFQHLQTWSFQKAVDIDCHTTFPLYFQISWLKYVTYNFVFKYLFCNSIVGFWEYLPTFSVNPYECEGLLKHWNFFTLAISAICWPLLQQHAKLILKKYPVLSRFDFIGFLPIEGTCKKGAEDFILILTSPYSYLQYTYLWEEERLHYSLEESPQLYCRGTLHQN